MRWQDGYPCDSGSTDGQDSARLAGLMWVFNHHQKIPYMSNYYSFNPVNDLRYLRHPVEGNKTPISRDQIVPLFAGFFVSGNKIFINPYYRPKGEITMPSVANHIGICGGMKPTLLGNLWLWFDVLWSCFIAPMAEPCQLICMLKKHPDKKYIRFWVNNNKLWREAIREYFFSQTPGKYNRGEPELAELMIKDLEQYEKDTIAR